MNVTIDDLLTIIGTKEAELFVLRKRIAELEQDGQQQLAVLRERLEAVPTEAA